MSQHTPAWPPAPCDSNSKSDNVDDFAASAQTIGSTPFRRLSDNQAEYSPSFAPQLPQTLSSAPRTSSHSDIWSPLYQQQFSTSSLRGKSFGTYGRPNFDSERYSLGNAAWGSAEDIPRRRLASFPASEPGSERGFNLSTPSPFGTLGASASSQTRPLDFTAPSFSILERFGSLTDATRQAELSQSNLWGSANHSASNSPSHRPLTLMHSATQPSSVPPVPVPVPALSPLSSMSQLHITPALPRVPGPTSASGSVVNTPTPNTKISAPVPPLGDASKLTPKVTPKATPKSTPKVTPKATPKNTPKNTPKSTPKFSESTLHPVPPTTTPGAKGKMRRRKRTDSPFIEQLRLAPSDKSSLADILGNAVEASTDQHGSRFIQEKLVTASPEMRHALLMEILPDALALSTDVFGNYVMQLMFEVSSPSDRELLRKQLESHVLMLTLHMYGCRVIQMALTYLSNSGRQKVVDELRGSVLRCIRDHNGNHVVQKAVEHVNPNDAQFIYDDMLEQALALSKHMYGCRVVQRALEFGGPDVKRRLLDVIERNVNTLVLDQYGNYVVQHVVEHGSKPDRNAILEQLSGNIVALSSHKYASNVIERCFVKSENRQRSSMVDTIVNSTYNGEPAVLSMMKDQFANYVIQRILGTAKDDDYERLSNAVKANLPAIRRMHQGKHLLAIERRLRR